MQVGFGTLDEGYSRAALRRACDCLGWSLAVGLWLLGLYLFLRRLSGGTSEALSLAPMLGAVLLGCATASLARLALWQSSPAIRWTALGVSAGGLFWLAGAFLAIVQRPVGTVLFVLLVGAHEALWWVAASSGWGRMQTEVAQAAVNEELVSEETSVTQQLTRSQTPEGESVAGTLRVEFAAGERLKVVHVPFAPPLASSPEVEAESVAGPDAAISVTHAQPFGFRCEVRRTGAALDPAAVTLEFVAHAVAEAT